MIEQTAELIWQWLRTTGAQAAVILAGAWLLYRALRVGLTRLERAVMADGGTNVDRQRRVVTLVGVARSTGLVAIVVAASLMLLAKLGFNITPLIAGAGVIGLAIGLGAQTLIRDLIGGLFIVFEDQYHIGDAVKVGGVSGSVERITLRVTYLRDLDGTLHIVPNGEMRVVSNRTTGWSRAVVDVSVGYAQDISRALAVLREVASEANADPALKPLLIEPLAVTGVEALEADSVRLRIMGKTQAGEQWAIARALRQRITEKLEAEGVAFPFPYARATRDAKDGEDPKGF